MDLAGVQAQVRAVLGEIQQAATTAGREYASVYSGHALLRVVSPLAEGADQIVADVALDLGYRLHAPLPCLAGIYTGGFQRPSSPVAEDPHAVFDRLLAQAEAVQVLDGSPSALLDGAAYAAVGRVVLRHADMLIAIWDGLPAEGAGGTAAVVAQARAWQVPVVLIDPRDPSSWRLDDDPARPAGRDLAAVVRRILAPPPPAAEELVAASAPPEGDTLSGSPPHARPGNSNIAPPLLQYLRTRPSGMFGGLFIGLVALCAFEWPFRSTPVRLGHRCIARARANWDSIWREPTPLDRALTDPISHLLREYFAWADGLADRYGIAHRDASVAPYVLAPLTVVMAVAAQILLGKEHVDHLIQAAVELAILSLNLLFYEAAIRAGYHERWIDYRSLAEELRHLAYLWPLGRPLRSAPRLSGEAAATEASQFAWVGWYGRAVARQGGLYPGVFTPQRLADCRDMLVEHFMRPQSHYHSRTLTRFRRVKERLHSTALWLFRIAWALAAVDFVVSLVFHQLPPTQTPLASAFGLGVIAAALAVVLPYVATGTHGFLSQGDFWNLSRRSERMCHQLEPLMSRIMSAPLTLEGLGSFAEDAADVMRDEVLNWRVFVRLKPPALG
jgi:hypothetical protein